VKRPIILTDYYYSIHHYKPRYVFRPEPTHPVFIHASVVYYLSTEPNYKPGALWYGLGKDEYPEVEDYEFLNGVQKVVWSEHQMELMNMNWKPKPSRRAQAGACAKRAVKRLAKSRVVQFGGLVLFLVLAHSVMGVPV
jgi:hypothetical protein